MGWIAGFDPAAVVGIFSGASTITPSLGVQFPGPRHLARDHPRTGSPCRPSRMPVTYPAAIVGIILVLLTFKFLLPNQSRRGVARIRGAQPSLGASLVAAPLVVTNPNLDGLALERIPGRIESGSPYSRLKRGGETSVATAEMTVRTGDWCHWSEQRKDSIRWSGSSAGAATRTSS